MFGLFGPLQLYYFDLCLRVTPLVRPVVHAAITWLWQGMTLSYVENNNNIFELLLFQHHS